MITLSRSNVQTMLLVSLAICMVAVPEIASANNGSEASSQEGWEMVLWFKGLMQGWLGAIIALIALLSGIITWMVAKNPWFVLTAWFIGVLLVKGPAMVLSMFTAVV